MTEVLMTCHSCDTDIVVDMATAILRTDAEPRADAELLFCCPACGTPARRHVVGELLTLLLLVGVEPLRLSEPALPEEDRPPALPPLTHDDLLTWHEQLAPVQYVIAWER